MAVSPLMADLVMVPVLTKPETVARFSNFQECYAPLSEVDIQTILVLTSDSWSHVWQPDAVRSALVTWRLNRQIDEEKANRKLSDVVDKAQQNVEFPKVFLRRFEQLRPILYPLQSIKNCEVLYESNYTANGMKGFRLAEDFFYQSSFSRVKEWLRQLPLQAHEQILLARAPEENLLLNWDLFIDHWDAFYCDSFCTLNVIGRDPRWFLFFHPDQIAVWGCTQQFALERMVRSDIWVPEPINYRNELLRIVQQERKLEEAATVASYSSG